MCGNAKEATTKTSSLSSAGGGGGVQLFNHLYPKRLIVCTSNLHHSTRRNEQYEIRSYHFWVNFPFK